MYDNSYRGMMGITQLLHDEWGPIMQNPYCVVVSGAPGGYNGSCRRHKVRKVGLTVRYGLFMSSFIETFL